MDGTGFARGGIGAIVHRKGRKGNDRRAGPGKGTADGREGGLRISRMARIRVVEKPCHPMGDKPI